MSLEDFKEAVKKAGPGQKAYVSNELYHKIRSSGGYEYDYEKGLHYYYGMVFELDNSEPNFRFGEYKEKGLI